MAVTAELAPILEPDLTAVLYQSVECNPVLAAVRSAARLEAEQIIDGHRQQLREADYGAVPLPVDALGSARGVVAAAAIYGQNSSEAADRYLGLQLDCQRLLTEAARKNTYEYFPPLRQTYDAEQQVYVSHGFSIAAMTEAGLSPVAEPDELDRRVNEYVEEQTYQAIGRLALAQPETAIPLRIRTISECPDWAIDAHARRCGQSYGGYVPEIAKLMIRDVVFDPITGDRHEEQVGIPGRPVNHAVIAAVLGAQGLIEAEELTKTELHGLQFVAHDSPLEFIAKLDEAASAGSGQQIFMGEVNFNDEANYDAVPAAAERRQAALQTQADNLAANILAMEEQGVDRWAATGLVEAMVKDILLAVAEADVSKAAAIFDEHTSRGLREVIGLRLQGQFEQAEARLEVVKAEAPAPGYCGAGSCGLERVGIGSDKAGAMKDMGLDSASSLKDTVRRCPNCNKKDIVYDLKNKKKGCTNCKATTGFARQ